MTRRYVHHNSDSDKTPFRAVLQKILNWLIRNGLKIITALVGPRKSTKCFRTLRIQRVLSRLHTIAPQVRDIHTDSPEMLANLALFLHTPPFNGLVSAEPQILIQKSLTIELF
jgi:hypothetical protein